MFDYELLLNVTDEMKVLGVIFDENGISPKNIEKCVEKIEKSLRIWSSKTLNLLERMVVIRTFALSLLWYVAGFIIIEQDYIKRFKKKIFEFLWEGRRDH